MRKILLISGIILVAAVLLISGSSVAQPWHYALYVEDYERCVHPENATGQDNEEYASLGSTPFEDYGWIILDMGLGMDKDQLFWVFADSSVTETYEVWVGETNDINDFVYLGPGEDDNDEPFYTPSYKVHDGWRYVYIKGTSGSTNGDPCYGAEIDAVGWS